MKTSEIEVEIVGSNNENLRFRPLSRSIRGRFDFNRLNDPMAKIEASKWPEPIPGQRLGISPDGVGYIAEPLHEEKFAPIKEKIQTQGMKLEPKEQTFENAHIPSWLYWIGKAVECGLAKITKGSMPTKIEGEPIKNFIFAKPEPTTTDKLTNALNRQSDLFEKLITKLSEK